MTGEPGKRHDVRAHWPEAVSDWLNSLKTASCVRAKRDFFDARLQWQGMVNLYKRSIFVIT